MFYCILLYATSRCYITHMTSSLPYRSLSYDKSHILFRVGKPPFHPVIRNFSLSNQFKVPVVLYDVRLPSKAQEYFHVRWVFLGLPCIQACTSFSTAHLEDGWKAKMPSHCGCAAMPSSDSVPRPLLGRVRLVHFSCFSSYCFGTSCQQS